MTPRRVFTELLRAVVSKPKPKSKFDHEEHEERKHFFQIRCPLRYPIFVSFATFVVRKSFVKRSLYDELDAIPARVI